MTKKSDSAVPRDYTAEVPVNPGVGKSVRTPDRRTVGMNAGMAAETIVGMIADEAAVAVTAETEAEARNTLETERATGRARARIRIERARKAEAKGNAQLGGSCQH